ncbi:phenylalanine--tRNA ligase subunit alpha [Candidatus Uhrbacteria bacterium]|nr:phenylalanine--tRNA ligase subunit alpha [Candidatus Uhrbacteria bacterium]
MQKEFELLKNDARVTLERATTPAALREWEILYLGRKGKLAQLMEKLGSLSVEERKKVGSVANAVKHDLQSALLALRSSKSEGGSASALDVTLPGIPPPEGHLHLVTQAIEEIENIFSRIGFNRVRHPEIDTDWYPFEALNMPKDHPARDEWETFFVENPKSQITNSKQIPNHKLQTLVLTPHTSNGQVREMEKGKLPIRMINLSKCYRRQSDVSHVPMFHQFEGLYIDRHVTIAHLKGVIEYFVHEFFGKNRTYRLRPFHFRFVEPGFEIDVSCDVCDGKGLACRLCKSGWLELAGAGMVHPNVLKAGGIDSKKYSGFAFGFGVERSYMMKAGLKVDDIRILYKNDFRFLEQF